jgi:hypothetical protein
LDHDLLPPLVPCGRSVVGPGVEFN